MMQLDKMNEKLLQTPNNEKCVFGEKDKVMIYSVAIWMLMIRY